MAKEDKWWTYKKTNNSQRVRAYSNPGVGEFIHKNEWNRHKPTNHNHSTKNDILAVLIVLFIIGTFAYLVMLSPPKQTVNENNFSAPKSVNTPESVKTPAQSKFVSTYIDPKGNTHEVTDYTSQGGSKYDVIIKSAQSSPSEPIVIINNSKAGKTSSSKDSSNNYIIEQIDTVKNSLNNFLNKPVPDTEKIIGNWEYSTELGYSKFNFKADNTGISDDYISVSLFGVPISEKTFFKYTISQGRIKLTEVKPCLFTSCDKDFSYEFIDNNNLIMGNLVYERKWI